MNDYQNKDVLEYLSNLESNSIDLVVTDPPYFIGYDKWDKQWKDESDYLEWCDEWTQELIRVLKPNRMLVVWGTLKSDTFLKYKLNILNKYDEIWPQNEIIWSYNWGGRTKSNFARKHEYAWCYSKGKNFLFNADDVRIERKMKKNIRNGSEYNKGTIPTCVWEKNNHTTSKDYIGWHSTTKNIDIISRLILAYSNENDTVLDVFMGSGTTAIASLRTNRYYIGCEKDEVYYNKSQQRIEEETKNQIKFE